MRKPRKQVLANTGLFHKMWRGHNREPVFEDDDDKRAYLRHIARTHKGEVEELLVIYSYGIMTNHVHETGGPRTPVETEDELEEAVDSLGHWMRNGHSGFGAEFNRRHKRQGKVAYDRPKTTEIEDERGVLEVMFYIDANPVRAGMVSHPSRYRWSSNRFYSYGERNEHTDMLTPPAAYLALGPTPKARQKKYRSLLDAYLRRNGLIDDRPRVEVDEPADPDGQSGAADRDELERERGPSVTSPIA